MDAPFRTSVLGPLGLVQPVGLPALAAALAGAASLWVADGLAGILGAGLALIAVAIALIDARRFLIPDELNAAAALLGLAVATLAAADPLESIGLALLRGGALASAFLALRVGYRYWRGRDGLGLGDVKLAAVAGIWLDGLMLPVAIEIAALAALVAVAVARLRSGRAIRATHRLPFGLFFAPAIWLAWFAGQMLEGVS